MATNRARKPLTDEQKKAHNKATDRYDRANVVRLVMKLNKKTDADILEYLSGLDNKQGYIKKIIRRDIAEQTEK